VVSLTGHFSTNHTPPHTHFKIFVSTCLNTFSMLSVQCFLLSIQASEINWRKCNLSRQDEHFSSIYLTVTEYQICTGLCASFQCPDRLFPIQTKYVSFGKVCTCGTGLFMSILKWCVHNLVFFWFWMCTFILMPIRYFQGYYEVDILYKDPFETNTD